MISDPVPLPAGDVVPAGDVPPIGAALVPVASPAGQLLELFLSGRSPETVRAYRRDVEHLARFLGVPSGAEAARLLIGRSQGQANALVLAYRNHLVERGLAPATVCRRLASVRSLTKLAKLLGLTSWSVEIPGVKALAYRDTRGPGRDGFRQLLGQLEGRQDAKAVRDRAILRLAYDLALRRFEIVGLDVEHLDLQAGTVSIRGKGRSARETITLPQPTRAALEAWLAARGLQAGPLFTALDPASRGRRLSGTGVYLVIRGLGERAGIRARPHGLRHASITRALDLFGGDIRKVQRHSRHARLETLSKYDDARRDPAGEVAGRLAEDV